MKRKARCALRGDKMLPHIHYDPDKTTTYMSDKTTVRLFFAIAAAFNLQVEHWDIESAYLHKKCEHNPPVYVRQFPRFDGSFKHDGKAGILVGTLYGDKEAGFVYLTAAAKFLRSLQFQQSEAEPCIFYRITSEYTTFLNINIDDIIIASTKPSVNNLAFAEIATKYKLKHLGFPSLYLGWTIHKLPTGDIHLSQPATIRTILSKTNLSHANPKRTPYLDNAELYPTTPEDEPAPIPTRVYQQILGDLRYIAHSTSPDIFFVVNHLTSSAHQPAVRHWNALKRLLMYLKGTIEHGIAYQCSYYRTPTSFRPAVTTNIRAYFMHHDLSHNQSDTRLESYSDTDHAASPDDRKSITGIVHTYNRSPISRSSTKQSITALSTCEAEYVGATAAAQQRNWLRRVLQDIKMLKSAPTPLYIDNQSAIQDAKNQGPTKRRKYIDIRHHFLCDQVRRGSIIVQHTPSIDMLADIFTKALRPKPFLYLRTKLRITPPAIARSSGSMLQGVCDHTDKSEQHRAANLAHVDHTERAIRRPRGT